MLQLAKVESMIGISVPGLSASESPRNAAEVLHAGQGAAPSTGPNHKDRFIVLGEDPSLASRTLREQVSPTFLRCAPTPPHAGDQTTPTLRGSTHCSHFYAQRFRPGQIRGDDYAMVCFQKQKAN